LLSASATELAPGKIRNHGTGVALTNGPHTSVLVESLYECCDHLKFGLSFLPRKTSKLLDYFCKLQIKSKSFTMETHFTFFEIDIVLLVKQKLMLGMWKPTPNRDILLQQITNSHGNKGYNKHTSENHSLG